MLSIIIERSASIDAMEWLETQDSVIKYNISPVFPMNLFASPFRFEFQDTEDAVMFSLRWAQHTIKTI